MMEYRDYSLKQVLELDGELIYLKALSQEDLEDYWECFVNGSVEADIFTGTFCKKFTKAGVRNYLERISTDDSRADFLIITKESNEVIGEVVLSDINLTNRSASFRVAIFNKKDFGKGYGTEALFFALSYGFGFLNLHRIELCVFPHNERAIHVYEKIGFKREGIVRDAWYFNHKYYDFILMSILEDEFREKYLCDEH